MTKERFNRYGHHSESTLCPKGCGISENDYHLFNCPNDKPIHKNIIETMSNLIGQNIGQGDFKKLSRELLPKPIKELITDFIGTNDTNNISEFLETPTARGILTKNYTNNLKNLWKEHENIKPKNNSEQIKLWIILISDAWQIAFYKNIWAPRCKLIDFTKKPRLQIEIPIDKKFRNINGKKQKQITNIIEEEDEIIDIQDLIIRARQELVAEEQQELEIRRLAEHELQGTTPEEFLDYDLNPFKEQNQITENTMEITLTGNDPVINQVGKDPGAWVKGGGCGSGGGMV
jgi:hypothetical protein